MKKYYVLGLGVLLGFFLLLLPVKADDVDYRIASYRGQLQIHEDNTASFIESVDYQFDSDYNGQYLSLGTSGKMPEGFDIVGEPTVTATKNGNQVDVTSEMENLGDGYRLKVYNAGQESDDVVLTVVWQLKNILFKYDDIAELNWVPISDWDQTLEKVSFSIETDKASRQSQLFVHRGYLAPSSNIEHLNQTYRVTANHVTGKLELHAYWDSDVIGGTSLPEKRLSAFLQLEKGITQRNSQLIKIFNTYLPILCFVLFLLAGLVYQSYRAFVNRFYLKPARLYEMPDDLSPLGVAQLVYNQSFEDLILTSKGKAKGKIRSDHLVQAEVLDLIDRGALIWEGDQLRLLSRTDLLDYEKEFITLAFGNRDSVLLSDLFSDYYFDENTEKQLRQKYSGSSLEGKMRQAGNHLIQRLRKISRSISESVKTSLSSYPETYRDLTMREQALSLLAMGLLGLNTILSVCSIVYLLTRSYYEQILWLYMVVTLLSMLAIVVMFRKVSIWQNNGALTAEGGQMRQLWDSFERMMSDIGTFKEAELESLIIWNRMLVYATLFGQADKVTHYMKIHQIQLLDSHLAESYVYISPHLHQMTRQFHHSVSSAQSASHFSISSGGSAGGGFSGGGGGGGGGAF
ncbi:DUF2207 domain-containing protein [Streptococcus saliviloxodontae]|uniref:Membrane protein n=1 Tax=Streptococcus saliviloxodontae TaxID=1349416 RepID=A0ABS2PNG0_9STRE|nr:DUF2207 domain-containing protein [Streptococcus saliviloxodontae]MBM7636911.1 putative membrane protein [Streptococcus saliviloxodontae]